MQLRYIWDAALNAYEMYPGYFYQIQEAGWKKMAKLIEITDLNAPELDIYARYSETQLKRIEEPAPGLFITESPNVTLRALRAGYEPVSLLTEPRHVDGEAREVLERCQNVPVYTGPQEVLRTLTGIPMTRGILCALRRRPYPSIEEVLKGARRIAVLDDVTNPTNVGAIMRSAAALQMDAVILTKGCSDPLYRRASRVSMGCVFQIPWTFVPKNEPDWLGTLKKLGFRTAAMALKGDSVSVDDPALMAEDKLAVILGEEGYGLPDETIDRCDYTVMIPMADGVDSLNVAAAGAVAFWQLGNRKR